MRRISLFSQLVLALVAGCGTAASTASTGGSGSTTSTGTSGTHTSGTAHTSGGATTTSSTGASGGSTTGGSASTGGSSGTASSSATSTGSSGGASSGGSASSSTGNAGDASVPVGASVLQFHNHVSRDGLFIDSAITEATSPNYALDTSFAGTFTGNVYASPLYVQNGPSGKGTFYVATEAGTVYALDESTGAVVWQRNVGTAATKTGAGCGNISPIGITGTPAIDLGTRLIVFDAAIANSSGAIATHSIFALSIDTGNIVWTVDVSTLTGTGGTAFSPQPQNQRGAVLMLNGIAYVPFGGHYGDCGTYHGWVVGVPLSGTGAKAWSTTAVGAAIWGPGGPASDGQSIFVTTGNGLNDNTTWAESEGLFRLDPGPSFTGATADFFALYNWNTLDSEDLDLSGSGPLVIDAPALTPSQLVMSQGKDGTLYLVDRTNLGGIATSTQLANVGALKVQSGQISNAGAWATVGGTTYVVVRPNGQNGGIGCPNGTSGDLVAVKIDPTAAQKMSVVWCAKSGGVGSPSITSSDGTHDAMVWAFAADPNNAAQLYSWDLATGTQVFKGGGTANKASNVRRFTTPIAVNGRIFVGGDNQLYAFKAN